MYSFIIINVRRYATLNRDVPASSDSIQEEEERFAKWHKSGSLSLQYILSATSNQLHRRASDDASAPPITPLKQVVYLNCVLKFRSYLTVNTLPSVA